MFVGVVVENFHKCREKQEREEKARRAEKHSRKMERKRKRKSGISFFIEQNVRKASIFAQIAANNTSCTTCLKLRFIVFVGCTVFCKRRHLKWCYCLFYYVCVKFFVSPLIGATTQRPVCYFIRSSAASTSIWSTQE